MKRETGPLGKMRVLSYELCKLTKISFPPREGSKFHCRLCGRTSSVTPISRWKYSRSDAIAPACDHQKSIPDPNRILELRNGRAGAQRPVSGELSLWNEFQSSAAMDTRPKQSGSRRKGTDEFFGPYLLRDCAARRLPQLTLERLPPVSDPYPASQHELPR